MYLALMELELWAYRLTNRLTDCKYIDLRKEIVLKTRRGPLGNTACVCANGRKGLYPIRIRTQRW